MRKERLVSSATLEPSKNRQEPRLMFPVANARRLSSKPKEWLMHASTLKASIPRKLTRSASLKSKRMMKMLMMSFLNPKKVGNARSLATSCSLTATKRPQFSKVWSLKLKPWTEPSTVELKLTWLSITI